VTNKTKGKIIKAGAVTLDVAVPLIAILTQFPVWVEKSSEATVSGLFLLLAVVSCIPFWKQLKEYFKSPSIWVVWIILLVVFICLRNIIDQMVIVCFFGTIANVIGAGVYKLGSIIENKDQEKE
jgi:phosphatidylserine synthase